MESNPTNQIENGKSFDPNDILRNRRVLLSMLWYPESDDEVLTSDEDLAKRRIEGVVVSRLNNIKQESISYFLIRLDVELGQYETKKGKKHRYVVVAFADHQVRILKGEEQGFVGNPRLCFIKNDDSIHISTDIVLDQLEYVSDDVSMELI